MSILAGDFTYSARRIAKRLPVSLVIMITLALGIGANSAIFSIFNAVLLQKLPFPAHDELTLVKQIKRLQGDANASFSVKEVDELHHESHAFKSIAEYHTMVFTMVGRNELTRVAAGVVSSDFFNDILRIKPQLGRTFSASDDVIGAPAAVLLTHEFWQSKFGGSKSVVGTYLTMNDRQYQVVGVLPPFPQFPNANDLYMSVSSCPFRSSEFVINSREARMLSVVARMAPDETLEKANTDVDTVSHRIIQANPASYPSQDGYTMSVIPIAEELIREVRPTLYTLLGTALLVLLIACANASGLLLAQNVERQREFAVRSALGCSRWRLARLMLTEVVMLAIGAALFGLALAYIASKFLNVHVASITGLATQAHIDATVLGFTFGLAILAGLIAGALPAMGTRYISSVLRENSEKSTAASHKNRGRKGLVIVQLAVTFVLLMGAALLITTVRNLQRVDLGFSSKNVVVAEMDLNWSRYGTAEEQRNFAKTLESRLQQMAGVQSYAVAATYPLDLAAENNPADRADVVFDDRSSEERSGRINSLVRRVSAGYFSTLGIEIADGRVLLASDDENGAAVAVVNRQLAKQHWPNASPIGHELSLDGGATWLKIVGIVGDEKRFALSEPPRPQVYVPYVQHPSWGRLNILLKATNPSSYEQPIRAMVHELTMCRRSIE